MVVSAPQVTLAPPTISSCLSNHKDKLDWSFLIWFGGAIKGLTNQWLHELVVEAALPPQQADDAVRWSGRLWLLVGADVLLGLLPYFSEREYPRLHAFIVGVAFIVTVIGIAVRVWLVHLVRHTSAALEEQMPGVTISTSTVDRLLDAHSYSVKLVTQRPADRNRDDRKHSRKLYAQWLQFDGPRVCRFYLDEMNYNIWCSRNFGRAAKGQPAVHTTTTTKGANLNIMACMSGNGVIHWTAVDRVHWAVFNDFLSYVSAREESEEPNTEAVFISDGAPAHAQAEQAALANSVYSIKRLPAYSPFFNPIEEVFSKFKSHDLWKIIVALMSLLVVYCGLAMAWWAVHKHLRMTSSADNSEALAGLLYAHERFVECEVALNIGVCVLEVALRWALLGE
ncbi:hypothetical protein HPB52_004024 [Rhipicephalus sanguineus]|uniref:Tc1-like transposase DDE domain-containing protein n=1 Tax=Rhipicephalus sanguineus TaxID=34632 RepID=A0A9D4PJY2_RHISA|nr:hypothetical protein HPB52_004024 [Rhipicephalus sanguineus]